LSIHYFAVDGLDGLMFWGETFATVEPMVMSPNPVHTARTTYMAENQGFITSSDSRRRRGGH
jgi:hypothetical protein